MISGGILQAANVPDSFNARTCSLSSGGRDKSPSGPETDPRCLRSPPASPHGATYTSISFEHLVEITGNSNSIMCLVSYTVIWIALNIQETFYTSEIFEHGTTLNVTLT